jgi:hypothetical protein
MLSTEDLISRYEKYTDQELLQAWINVDDYSAEAKKALEIEMAKRGGEEKLLQQLKDARSIFVENKRIHDEIASIYTPGTDVDFYKKMITSEILSPKQLEEAIDNAWLDVKAKSDDEEVKPDTIGKCIVGGALAAIVAGVLCGLQITSSSRIFVILLAAQALVCYGIVKLVARKSYKNSAVIFTSFVAFLLSFAIGAVLANAGVFN